MPAEITTGRFCADYIGKFQVPGSKGDTYTVTLGVMDAYCDCKGWQYRRDCKHVKQVWEQACLWNCQWYDGGEVTLRPVDHDSSYPMFADDPCPHCGGATIPVKIAV